MRYDPGCRRLIGILIVDAFCVVTMAGCVGYQLGTTLSKNLSSIHMPTFINKCGEPQVENETTSAAKTEFQKDGTLSIANAEEADLKLDVTLVKYDLEPLRFDKTDPRTAEEYRLKLTADLVLTQVKPNKILLKKRVEVQTTFYSGGDIISAKHTALPKAAADLAHNIVENVVETW
jgi:hypothetical protein